MRFVAAIGNDNTVQGHDVIANPLLHLSAVGLTAVMLLCALIP